MPTTPRGIVYPDSSGHTRLWEHLQAQADSVEAAIDALLVDTSPIALTPTMAVSSHAFYIGRIGPKAVAVSGYLDVDDAVLGRRDTGMRIPADMRPTSSVIMAFPQAGGSGTYRYFFDPSGVIDFEQTAGNNGPFEGVSGVWFTA